MSASVASVEAPTLTARSVVLSLLLGAPSVGLAARDVVAVAKRFGLAASTVRVALSRLTSAGELVSTDSVYRLSERHLLRQRAQEEALRPAVGSWDGSWRTVVVTATGRGATERAELRRLLVRRRLAELREGVWLRPDNLGPLDLPDVDAVQLDSRPDDPDALVGRLWDLGTWAGTARALVDVAASDAPLAERFVANAGIVRHLRTDPHLPDALLPAHWPGEEVRRTYEAFRAEIADLTGAVPPPHRCLSDRDRSDAPASVPQQPKDASFGCPGTDGPHPEEDR